MNNKKELEKNISKIFIYPSIKKQEKFEKKEDTKKKIWYNVQTNKIQRDI